MGILLLEVDTLIYLLNYMIDGLEFKISVYSRRLIYKNGRNFHKQLLYISKSPI